MVKLIYNSKSMRGSRSINRLFLALSISVFLSFCLYELTLQAEDNHRRDVKTQCPLHEIGTAVSSHTNVLLALVSGNKGAGKDDRSNKYPERIISFMPTITEELFLLGVGERLVGVSIYCQRPSEAQHKEKVGTVVEANLETILKLRPDLIIVSTLINRKHQLKLHDLNIRVEVFQEPEDYDGICKNFIRLAHLVGQEARAKELVNTAKREISVIKQRVKGLEKPNVFIQIGANPLFTAKGDTYFNDYIEFAGGINIAKDAEIGAYSVEEVINRNPDVIIIVTMGILEDTERNRWLNYKTINAVKTKRIYVIDSYRVCSSTPVSFVETVKDMAKILHNIE